jgi:membrane protease YdiL (CAAX protease family)
MNFWARRPLSTNLAGALLLLLLWLLLTVTSSQIHSLSTSLFWRERTPYITLLLATIATTLLYDRLPPAWAGIGFHHWMGRELGQGLLLGASMALVAWSITLPFTSVTAGEAGPAGSYLYWTAFILLGAAGEELLFRGYLFQRMIEIIGVTSATILGSLLFALAHLRNPEISALAIINIFLAGIFFSLCYIRTGSLWLPIAAHAAWNLALAQILGTPVSGLEFGGSLLNTGRNGAAFWTGGAFGPEGGIAATVALLAGGIVLWRIPAITYSPYIHAKIFHALYNRERNRLGNAADN